jgi:hypothetical protein
VDTTHLDGPGEKRGRKKGKEEGKREKRKGKGKRRGKGERDGSRFRGIFSHVFFFSCFPLFPLFPFLTLSGGRFGLTAWRFANILPTPNTFLLGGLVCGSSVKRFELWPIQAIGREACPDGVRCARSAGNDEVLATHFVDGGRAGGRMFDLAGLVAAIAKP